VLYNPVYRPSLIKPKWAPPTFLFSGALEERTLVDPYAVTARVWELAEPLVLAGGLELVDVQFRPESGRVVLRLLMDRPAGGVTLEELARVSRELGDVLDAHDAVPGRYHLECSSPGLNRPLVREPHYRRAIGQRVRVQTRELIGERRRFRGTLEAVSSEGITLREGDASSVFVPFPAIERANVEHEFTRPTGPRAA
jgi:ribosome maturation factor RimP